MTTAIPPQTIKAEGPVPLHMGVKTTPWRTEGEKRQLQSAAWRQTRAAILKRDKGTCQGCGLAQPTYQEVHHRNHDHADMDPSNLTTLCPWCHQVFHIGRAAQRGAVLAWLPELTQAQINALCQGASWARQCGDAQQKTQAGAAKHCLAQASAQASAMLEGTPAPLLAVANALLKRPGTNASQLLAPITPHGSQGQVVDGWRLVATRSPMPAKNVAQWGASAVWPRFEHAWHQLQAAKAGANQP
ncbi:HNH endonuclease [Formicincola oecophyllae]|uniref:HNH endonuclease n=1 Tax=Formicincola oecophyllae TaxID=2558361 RepID=A0A4Y6UBJ9_9PROT|nr:HNH endonuclease [Formicincola oecophyllae]QDH13847.1 HNH endonuclease [Formicincola oecophyllae]